MAHRVVHGGPRFREPVVVDAGVREAIHALEPLAPLHNAPALRGIDAAQRVLPDVPHVAVFDTAFHATIPEEASTYALPARWREEWGIRRYGFHGLSVAWAAGQVSRPAARRLPPGRRVVGHAPSGTDGRSIRRWA